MSLSIMKNKAMAISIESVVLLFSMHYINSIQIEFMKELMKV